MSQPRAAEVIVPATSANLGCAFDCAALAVNKFLRARAVRAAAGVSLRYSGPHPERVPPGRTNLLLRAVDAFVGAHLRVRPAASVGADTQVRPYGLQIEIENEIPVGVGLGSSAAAIVAGLLLARALYAPRISDDELLSLACELEGHPDNVTAALHGGLTLACHDRESRRVLWAKAPVPSHVKIIAIVPHTAVSTKESRGVLPAQYSREDLVHSLQRASLLAAACFSGKFELQPELFSDHVHQPYRAAAVPGITEALEVRHADLLGVFLSGSGSTVLALARGRESEIADALLACFTKRGQAAEALLLQAENRGARILPHAAQPEHVTPRAAKALEAAS